MSTYLRLYGVLVDLLRNTSVLAPAAEPPTGLRHSPRTLTSHSKPDIEKIDKNLWILTQHNPQTPAELKTLPAA